MNHLLYIRLEEPHPCKLTKRTPNTDPLISCISLAQKITDPHRKELQSSTKSVNTKNSFSGSSLDPLTTLLLIWIPGCSLVPSLSFWPVLLLFMSPGASSQMENRFAPKGIAGSLH